MKIDADDLRRQAAALAGRSEYGPDPYGETWSV
jgi:hypothetical protein